MTAGRYYFAADSTPHYPGVHLLGSATWDDTNIDAIYPLGEARDGSATRDLGEAPALLPLPILVGSRDCVAAGELFANALKDADLLLGLPAACYFRPELQDRGFLFLSDLKSCETQKFYCRLIQAIYADDDAAAFDLVAKFVPGNNAATFHFATANLPGCVTILNDNYSCIVCDGTRNFETLVAEAMYSLVGPVNFGRFGTMPLWYHAATWLTNWLTIDGADPARPMIFAGHSYGAAAATVAAVRANFPSTGGPRFLFTIGCPKPGDLRLAALVKGIKAINLANDDDLITILPPSQDLLFQLVGDVGPAVLDYWSGWASVMNQVIQAPDGSLRLGSPEDPGFGRLLDCVTRAIAHANLDIFEPHYVSTYISRIIKRCPDDFAQVELAVGADVAAAELAVGAEWKAVPGPDCEHGYVIHLNETYVLQLKDGGGGVFKHPCIVGRRYTLTVTQDYTGLENWGDWIASLACVPGLGIISFYGTSSPFFVPTPYSVDIPYALDELLIRLYPVTGVTINYTLRLTVERAEIMGAEDGSDILVEDGSYLFIE